ncbi:ATP-binding protein [Arenimonas sp. GDDSR-1]|uniref:ATP-binding protein n=1 Tax=Arenimonas sp. GDDSR-1 TaxID=2950125 RepID=UPI002639759A|nr:ATP-binding protein [Arenimonas sp. GDDSR-1]
MKQNPTVQLRTWMWRAFMQSALIPLLLVETVLIAVYLLSNSAIRDAQIEYLRENARNDLRAVASQESRVIDQQLSAIGALTRMYANEVGSALRDPKTVPLTSNLALTDTGVHYSPKDDGRPAVFYSAALWKKSGHDLVKLAKLEHVDGLMRQIKAENPLVSAIYFNSWDSLNYIYPWFLTPEQYDHNMPIPDYNFYYLADAKHNPKRGVVWTDVYVDPAGQGWMMSAIAPVYRADFLEGVVGLDVTVGNILTEISNLKVPWNGYAVLVSDELNIMALPEAGEADFGLTELTDFTYDEAISKERYKPSDFNLGKRKDTQKLARAMQANASGIIALPLGGKSHLVAWTRIEQTGWRLMAVVAEEDIFQQTNMLAGRFTQIGYLLIAGLVFFYAVFFTYMWLRSRSLSARLEKPIIGVSRMLDQIGNGLWQPARAGSEISELDAMAGHASAMGQRLGQSEAERQQAQQRLELVLEGTTESVWEQDLRANTVTVRGRFAKRFGLSGETVTEEEFRSHGHPEDLKAVFEAKQLAVDGVQDFYYSEYRFADAVGNYHWLLSRGRVLERDPQTGKALLVGGTHHDIDALKNTEMELREASLEAQAASVAKSRFISSMTHELRTPLNAIQGFAQLIRMQHPSGSGNDEPQYIDEIISASSHLNQVVGDILEWSSAQSEPQSIELQPVIVREAMLACAELVRVEIERAGLTLNLDLPPEDFSVPADPRRLRQVIINLISNAIKYNSPEGQITLTYQIAGQHVRIIVEDTGMGIGAELQGQLFQPFQRLGRENTAILGTGLGLSLCREFATLMGGRMGVSSHPGIGSSFWIELPLNRSVPPVPATAPLTSEQPRALPRVVLVEDNPASQFLVKMALEDMACIDVVADGREALARILDAPPVLLLLDINLPGMNGKDLLQALRADVRTRALKVVVLSGVVGAGQLLDLDCQGFLAKPLDSAELRRLVSALLNSRG